MKTALSFVLTCWVFIANSQLLELQESTDEAWVTAKHFYLFEDTSAQLGIEQVSSADFAGFKRVQSEEELRTQDPESNYWIRFEVKNSTSRTEKWVVEYLDLNVNYISFFSKSGGKWTERHSGNFEPFPEKSLKHKNYEFFIQLEPDEQKVFFMKFRSENVNQMEPVIRSYPRFVNRALSEYYALGIYYGAMILIAIYNLLFFFAVRTRAYLFHVVYIFSAIFYSLCEDGMGFQYIWPNSPALNHYSHSLSLMFLEMSAVHFSIAFLNMKVLATKVHKLFIGLAILIPIRFLIAFFADGFPVVENGFDLLPFFLAFLAAGYFFFYKKYVPARYFLMAYVILFSGFLISTLEHIDLIESSDFTFYAMYFAGVIEVIFLSFALVHKIRNTIVEKEEAQQQLVEELRLKEEMQERHTEELEFKVTERTKELDTQKKIVELKNENITSSITYAKNIQNAILPSNKEVKKAFPESFLIYWPRDIVSGDFYYLAKQGANVLFAVADCTGHGVPGGFMSMIGHTLLNESIFTHHIGSPAKILDELNLGVIKALKQKEEGSNVKDGMDISLFKIDFESGKLQFAGANNSMFIVRDSELIMLKADRQPIGDGSTRHFSFNEQEFQLKSGDCLYAFSDGYVDQFGGKQGKKFLKKRFKEMLTSIAIQPMADQRVILEGAFKEWQGHEEQVDDVTVFGMRF